jgi:hypothetical protein
VILIVVVECRCLHLVYRVAAAHFSDLLQCRCFFLLAALSVERRYCVAVGRRQRRRVVVCCRSSRLRQLSLPHPRSPHSLHWSPSQHRQHRSCSVIVSATSFIAVAAPSVAVAASLGRCCLRCCVATNSCFLAGSRPYEANTCSGMGQRQTPAPPASMPEAARLAAILPVDPAL